MYRELPDRPFDLEALPLEEAIRHVRQVVRAWVVPWALGEGDPVREPLLRLSEDYPQAFDRAGRPSASDAISS